MVIHAPVFFLRSRKKGWGIVKRWAHLCGWLQKIIVGTKYEVIGRENLPEGGFIAASKHQSFWDTYSLLPLFDEPAYILKRELMWIPFFGWYLKKAGQIPVNRGKRSVALRDMTAKAEEAINEGRQIIIYPEGTRKAPGSEPAYKYGIAHMYRQMNCKVVPIAVNSGLFWPRRSFLRYPGKITIKIFPPIEPGLELEVFQKQLIECIEAGCDELLLDVANNQPQVPLNEAAQKRVDELRK